jgi:hypothetical protein
MKVLNMLFSLKTSSSIAVLISLAVFIGSCVSTSPSSAKQPMTAVTPEKRIDLNDPSQRALRKRKLAAEGFNEFCDPLSTVYMGGNPLFDSLTGNTKSLDDYIKEKGFDQWCNPLTKKSEKR